MVIFPPSAESNKGEIAGCFNLIEFLFKIFIWLLYFGPCCEGIVTARDLLRFICTNNLLHNDDDMSDRSSSSSRCDSSNCYMCISSKEIEVHVYS